jgi:hypothetical protein
VVYLYRRDARAALAVAGQIWFGLWIDFRIYAQRKRRKIEIAEKAIRLRRFFAVRQEYC